MPNNLVFNNIAQDLKTQIYGITNDGTVTAILTDAAGHLDIVGTVTAISSTAFTTLETLINNIVDTIQVAFTIDSSLLRTYSFYITNIGSNTATVWLQVSPTDNSTYFVDDQSARRTLPPVSNNRLVIVPAYFLNYTRMLVQAGAGATVTARAYFNAQY